MKYFQILTAQSKLVESNLFPPSCTEEADLVVT